MIKINSLELDDVKRIRAVRIEPTENGLTVIGGKNNQGKTSVLDAIAWALGGDKFRPSAAVRNGSAVPPRLKVTLSNGIVVERSGKNSDLKVTDSSGKRGGQQLLNAFISSFALDLPRFMGSSSKEKANVLLQIIGVRDELNDLDRQENILYNRRLEIGRIAEQKEKYAAELPEYTDVPKEPVSPSELIRQQQDILARNGENGRCRERAAQLRQDYENCVEKIRMLRQQLHTLEDQEAKLSEDMRTAELTASELRDESTEELERNIREIEKINIKVRSNLDKERAEAEAEKFRNDYDELTEEINNIRESRRKLLDNAELPLRGLSVEKGELTYNGARWDCMSGSDQLRAATAIVRKLNPDCGFVLIDKLEQMDMETMNEFGTWLEAEGLQAIATRVSTGGECSIIIEDGYVKQSSAADNITGNKKWKEGVF